MPVVGTFLRGEMLEVISTKTLLSRVKYPGCYWLDTRLWWQRPEDVALKALCEENAPLERSADALGRSPTSIAWRARDTGLILPREWRDAITKRRPASPRTSPLQYPYIVQVRGEHADLLAVNALVTHGLPDQVRADVCQEMMLAIWQKQTTVDELRRDPALVRKFITSFRKANLEGAGYALSLDVPMYDGRRWYDVLADTSSDYDEDECDDGVSALSATQGNEQ